ncbi:Vinc [Bugula neritina]|uniref:Vinculin n=1 Tax=Bugula neritina TaxID=10212 RepID=A0A7J7JCC2_BUGNE|nr:Vinc [Bugula neritina]
METKISAHTQKSVGNVATLDLLKASGVWITDDQLFIGYKVKNRIEDVICLCRQTSQNIHNSSTLSSNESLAKFEGVMDLQINNIMDGVVELTGNNQSKKLCDYLLRKLELIHLINPLLCSSISAYIASESETTRALATQNKNCFQHDMQEAIRNVVLCLQSTEKQLLEHIPCFNKEDDFSLAQEWLSEKSSVRSSTGFQSVEMCIKYGNKLAGLLCDGAEKRQLKVLCCRVELAANQLKDLHAKRTIREGHERIGTNQLAYHLSHLKDGIIETISRKTFDDFQHFNLPLNMLEKAALTAHFKQHREQVFVEKQLHFEEMHRRLVTNINLICWIHMIPNASKMEKVQHEAAVLSASSSYVVWGAKLLFSNPYNNVFQKHFTKVKQVWQLKVNQLKSLCLSEANLRTYKKHTGDLSFSSQLMLLANPANTDSQVFHEHLLKKGEDVDKPTNWASADSDLILTAKKLATVMSKLVDLVRNDRCTKERLLQSSQNISRTSDAFSCLTKHLAMKCADEYSQSLLLKLYERIPTLSTQLKMVCTVKAATIGSGTGMFKIK